MDSAKGTVNEFRADVSCFFKNDQNFSEFQKAADYMERFNFGNFRYV
jgi:hypothetical protein